MSVLLLCLCGPMQSWGVQSRFGVRDTGLEPSKSGVVGLLCAALGRRRHEPIEDLARLRMGVRVDVEGTMAYDYHTAQDVLVPDLSKTKHTELSWRYYLTDAHFLVGLEGTDVGLLRDLHEALRHPHWPLYLGRKAFVPGRPVWMEDGLWLDWSLEEALRSYHWLGSERWKRPAEVRWVLGDREGLEVRPDQPVSFAERRFLPRRVRTSSEPAPPLKEEPCTSPD